MLRLHLESKSDASVEGIFMGFTAGHYRLANARHVAAEEQTVPLEGEAWVPRDRVIYAQVIG